MKARKCEDAGAFVSFGISVLVLAENVDIEVKSVEAKDA